MTNFPSDDMMCQAFARVRAQYAGSAFRVVPLPGSRADGRLLLVEAFRCLVRGLYLLLRPRQWCPFVPKM